MKKVFYLLTAAILMAANTHALALEKNIKMGKPTDEELNMTTYDADPDADAVCLYHGTVVSFRLAMDGLKVVYDHKARIKVLKPEGVDWGNVEIVYYHPDKDIRKEIIKGVKGTAFNLENGKVVKSKVNGDLKTDEVIDKNHHCYKFTIPNVKVGSVIEYEYSVESDYYTSIPDWYAQWSIPIKYTDYNVVAPSFFKFNRACTGIYQLKTKTSDATFQYSTRNGSGTWDATREEYWAEDLPKMEREDYIFYINDYKSRVVYDLYCIDFPGQAPQYFNSTWDEIDKRLREYEDFGGLFKMDNIMPDLGVYLNGSDIKARKLEKALESEGQVRTLSLDGKTTKEKVSLMRSAMLEKIKWDDSYSIWGKSARQIVKDRNANCGSLCFTLMAFLKEAGINAEPVLLSRRTRGRLNISHPSTDSFNAMILQVKDSTETFYVDATSTNYPVGTLPGNMLVTEARLIQKAGGAIFVDLSKYGKASEQSFTNATLDEEGNVSGLLVRRFGGLASGAFRSGHKNKKDSLTYVEALAARLETEISDYRTSDLSLLTENSLDSISFTKTVESDGETIYLNPFLFVDMKSPFKNDTRVLPIECECPVTEKYNIQIKLPEGYSPEEMPKPVQVRLEDGKTTCRIVPGYNNTTGTISIAINYVRNTTFYGANQFPTLRTFWSTIEDCCNSVVVLKKNQQ